MGLVTRTWVFANTIIHGLERFTGISISHPALSLRIKIRLGVVVFAYNLSASEAKAGDCYEFQTSLEYLVRYQLKESKTNKQKCNWP